MLPLYQSIGNNYTKTIDSLNARFGSPDLLLVYYVRDLLKLTLGIISSQSKFNLW